MSAALPAAFAATPEPPYYAVIFASQRSVEAEADGGGEDYAQWAQWMVELAAQQPGFLGIESARDADGFGLTVSYWRSADAIRAWKAQADHQRAQALGRSRWYARYALKIARVERAYSFEA